MPVAAKICGLSTAQTVDAALAAHARWIGLVFFAKSPRNISLDQAAALAKRVQGRASVVGLFVNPDHDFLEAACASVSLDVLQFHGSESPADLAGWKQQFGKEQWKAIPLRRRQDLAHSKPYETVADALLFDAKAPEGSPLPGGNGLRFDWTLLDDYQSARPWILSGGLDAENVTQAVAITKAQAVDVSSGVETEAGIKNVDKITHFLKAVGQL